VNGAVPHADTQEIVVDEIFPHSPVVIWTTLTHAGLIARFIRMVPIGFEPVVGNKFSFQTTPAGEWDGVIHCEVLDVVPNERFSYSWKAGHATNVGYGSLLDSVVTWTLSKVAGGTRIRLVHSGFVMPTNESTFKNLSGGWKHVVGDVGNFSGERD
jgi:uncharacterized protein YndB with AHSA1/START domain